MDKGKIIAGIVAIVVLVVLFAQCSEDSEYEKAGKTFGSWVNKDPKYWSDTEKEYFNNFMDWSDSH